MVCELIFIDFLCLGFLLLEDLLHMLHLLSLHVLDEFSLDLRLGGLFLLLLLGFTLLRLLHHLRFLFNGNSGIGNFLLGGLGEGLGYLLWRFKFILHLLNDSLEFWLGLILLQLLL